MSFIKQNRVVGREKTEMERLEKINIEIFSKYMYIFSQKS